jgi:hypothetical protein
MLLLGRDGPIGTVTEGDAIDMLGRPASAHKDKEAI